MIRRYPVGYEYDRIDNLVHELCDGESQSIAVEIFNHPDCVTGPRGETFGPWVIGPKKEVLAWLAEHDYTDFAIQVTHGPHEEDDDE